MSSPKKISNQHHFPAKVSHKLMALVTSLTSSVVIIELVVGYNINSLAIVSDAAHNFADAIAVVSSWYAMWMAQKPTTNKHTFGYHRTGVIFTFVNALVLIIMALIICQKAYMRYLNPINTEGSTMIIMALIAASVNFINGILLHKASKEDINMRSAFVHVVGDIATALGVVVAGILIMLTGILIIDPIVSFIVGLFILWSSIRLFTDSVNFLMESVPPDIDMEDLGHTINSIDGVVRFYDLHVWAIMSGFVACSFHVITDKRNLKAYNAVLRTLEEQLHNKFNITHSTIQIETDDSK